MKVFFLVLVNVFNFDLFEFSAAILEKGLLQYLKRIYNWQLFNIKKGHNTKSTDFYRLSSYLENREITENEL